MDENKIVENDVETEQEQQEQEQEQEYTVTDEDVLNALKTPTEAVKAFLDNYAKEAVKAALAKSTPKKSTVRVEPITKERFENMTYAEREKLFNENRDLYNKLTK